MRRLDSHSREAGVFSFADDLFDFLEDCLEHDWEGGELAPIDPGTPPPPPLNPSLSALVRLSSLSKSYVHLAA